VRPDTLAQSSDLEIIAPVDTFTSLNVANLVSTRDYVARISGAGAVESVPDEFVRSPWGEPVIVGAARMACDSDADLLVVHARVYDGTGPRHPEVLDYYRQLTEGLGGSFVEIDGDAPAPVLAEQASAHNASSVVVARHRSAQRSPARLGCPKTSPTTGALPLVEVRDRTTFNTATD